MVRAKSSENWDFLMPLAAHAGIHALFTLMIILVVNSHLWWLALVDFFIHFTMDRIKSGPKYLGRYNDMKRPSYWNCFGVDQMVHHFTHYGIVFLLMESLL